MTEEANMTESSTEIVSHEQQPEVAQEVSEKVGAHRQAMLEQTMVVAADEQPEDQHPGQHWNTVHQMWMDN